MSDTCAATNNLELWIKQLSPNDPVIDAKLIKKFTDVKWYIMSMEVWNMTFTEEDSERQLSEKEKESWSAIPVLVLKLSFFFFLN